MESKAQKAALATIENMVANLIWNIEGHGDGISLSKCSDRNKSVEEVIKEYNLDKKLLADANSEIYDALMKNKKYVLAAQFAKKYGL